MLSNQREKFIEAIAVPGTIWDVVVVGGGATGLGTALDAASRGYKTLLLEQADFAKGTSSRSTKLIHGGVRYLAQGNIGLVKEALYERGLLQKNAAHLVKNEAFVIPVYKWWSGVQYTLGLKIYDLLAGKYSFGASKSISKDETVARLHTIKQSKLRGGVLYHDGQFDDSRLAINLALTCIEQGATVINYVQVTGLLKTDGKISGVTAKDIETGKIYQVNAKSVINATGVFVDDLIQKDEPHKQPLVKSSQGIHLVLDRSFMPGNDAIMIPRTDDGRVLFVVPWHGKLLIGTTDTPLNAHSLEPVALEEEISFIIRTVGKYLIKVPSRKDVRSIFAGLRPLAAPQSGAMKTKEISRGHKIIVSDSGLITVTGGKWTTYRRMAEDTVDRAVTIGGLQPVACRTSSLSIHGNRKDVDFADHLYVYGADREALLTLIDENKCWAEKLHPKLDYIKAEVIWAVRHEMARNIEDVLARRLRALFLDARAAIEIAAKVACLMTQELNKDENWQNIQVADFTHLAQGYLLIGS